MVTGSTGNVGREVVRTLCARGMRVKAADRDPSRARAKFGEAVEAVRLDFRDPSSFASAEGADALLLLRPPAIADVRSTLLSFVDEARRRGVRHVVFLSVAGAERNRLVPHHAVEQHLMRSSGWTILRPGFFAQNFGDAYRRDIVEESRVYVPAGRGRVAFVDVRDLAEVAAMAFASPSAHDGRAYTLTGGQAIDFAAAAAQLSEAIGRTIRYEPASLAGYAAHLRDRGMPWMQIAVQTVLHAGLRVGQAERVDPTLARLLGRPPRTMAQYFCDNRETWARGARRPTSS